MIGLTLYSLCPSWVPSCGLRLGAAAEHEIYESLSVCLPLRLDIFHLLKTCHPVSSGVSRMRSVALCPHGITMQIGQWNLPQGNVSLRSNVSSNYAQPTSTVTRTHQMHLVGWCELFHMVIVLKQMCQSWMCPSFPDPDQSGSLCDLRLGSCSCCFIKFTCGSQRGARRCLAV